MSTVSLFDMMHKCQSSPSLTYAQMSIVSSVLAYSAAIHLSRSDIIQQVIHLPRCDIYSFFHLSRYDIFTFHLSFPLLHIRYGFHSSFPLLQAPKGSRGCLMSPLCLESQECHLIPLYYLLSCASAKSYYSFCPIFFSACWTILLNFF